MGRPILVTGSHRSGTTWVGRMLCASGEAGYIHEPFNPARRPGWSGDSIPFWFLHVTEATTPLYEPVVRRFLEFRYPIAPNLPELRGPKETFLFLSDLARSVVYRVRKPRPLVKDPIALFSTEWLAERFDMDVVVLIRNPLAFAGSIKKLNWQNRFRGWVAQEHLMEGWLQPFREQVQHCFENEVDVVEQAIVMWNAMHHVIARYRERHPRWHFVRHEDLATDPVAGFRRLYAGLGLSFSDGAERAVASHSGEANPSEVPVWRHRSIRRNSRATAAAWRQRLTREEARRVREATREVARHFYAESELAPVTA